MSPPEAPALLPVLLDWVPIVLELDWVPVVLELDWVPVVLGLDWVPVVPLQAAVFPPDHRMKAGVRFQVPSVFRSTTMPLLPDWSMVVMVPWVPIPCDAPMVDEPLGITAIAFALCTMLEGKFPCRICLKTSVAARTT